MSYTPYEPRPGYHVHEWGVNDVHLHALPSWWRHPLRYRRARRELEAAVKVRASEIRERFPLDVQVWGTGRADRALWKGPRRGE